MKHALPLHRQLHSSEKGFFSLVHNFTTSGFVKWCTWMVTFIIMGVLRETCCLCNIHICELGKKNLHKLFSYAVTMTLCIYCTWKEAVLHAHMQNKTNNGHQIGSRMDEWKRIWIHVLNWWIVFPNCHP